MSAATFFQADPTQQGSMEKRFLIDASPDGLSLFRGLYQRINPFGSESILQVIDNAKFGAQTSTKLKRAGDHLMWSHVQTKLSPLYAKKEENSTQTKYIVASNMQSAGTGALTPAACDDTGSGKNVLSYLKAIGAAYQDFTEISAPSPATNVVGYDLAPSSTFLVDTDSPTDGNTDEAWAIWSDEIANVLIKDLEIKCNNNRIDRFTREYLHSYHELFNRKNVNQILGIHGSVDQAIRDAAVPQYVYTPIPAYFCRSMGNLFDLASALFTVPTFNITWAPLRDCIVVGPHTGDVFQVKGSSGDAPEIQQAILDTTQIVVTEAERVRLHQYKHRQLISQVQSRSFTKKDLKKVELDVKFPNPCLELIFEVRRDCATQRNMWFHFWGIAGYDPIKSVELLVNSVPKEQVRQGEYFRKMKPLYMHTSVPTSCVYCDPFALDPEAPEFPTGYFALGRMDSSKLVLELQDELSAESVEIFVHARTYNVLEYSNASAHPLFVAS